MQGSPRGAQSERGVPGEGLGVRQQALAREAVWAETERVQAVALENFQVQKFLEKGVVLEIVGLCSS